MSHWLHGMHAAHGASDKSAGVIYIIVGIFLAPILIGIPIIIYGIYKLFK